MSAFTNALRRPLRALGLLNAQDQPISGALHGPLVSDADTLTLGLPGSPTNDQTIQPAASTSGVGASLNLFAKAAADGDNYGGTVALHGGDGIGTGEGGYIQLQAGTGGSSGADGGRITITAGNPGGGGNPGLILLNGGPVIADHAITAPQFIVSAIPTSDPLVAGQLWNDSGTVKISAGPPP
jgi:hypothetical protein